MKLTKKWGLILLAVWLILNAALDIVGLRAAVPAIIWNILAIAAGILILIDL
jgi:hypothetical protein